MILVMQPKPIRAKISSLIKYLNYDSNILFLKDKKPDDGLDWFLERIERSERMIMTLMEQLEDSATDSILDLGLSKFEHREKFRNFALQKGYDCRLHFLDISRGTRLTRINKRNIEKGETYEFEVSQEDFDFMENWFEKPTESELLNGKIIVEQ